MVRQRTNALKHVGSGMKLVIVHSHFRPGGVRRVIESALLQLGRLPTPAFNSIVLLAGEDIDPSWLAMLRQGLSDTPLIPAVDRSFGYLTDLRDPAPRIRRILRARLTQVLDGSGPENTRVWAHNLGLARNPILTAELVRIATQRNIPLLVHHHDWWFDNRWPRWTDLTRAGVRSLPDAARWLLPKSPVVQHASINRTEADILRRHFPGRSAWLPNPADRNTDTTASKTSNAATATATRRWLKDHHGVSAPFWILPCRLLRRKNIAEALLLTRWLRPEAQLVTTGSASSREEQAYATTLSLAARRGGWPLHLAVLGKEERNAPSVAQLLDAAECVVLTSLIEGFGLPFLEATAAGKPLIARRLPLIQPDLDHFGFRFPALYDEVLVPPGLFNAAREQRRQQRRFEHWIEAMPRPCRRWVEKPVLLQTPSPTGPVPFSRLTLRAQLEVLEIPAHESWKACAPFNPTLAAWHANPDRIPPQPTPWPPSAETWVGGESYVRRLLQLLRPPKVPARANARHRAPPCRPAEAAQETLMRLKLSRDNLYPLLWTPRP